ncbi:hypothetical protein Dimus_020750, partial [Dionaea muscipula]
NVEAQEAYSHMQQQLQRESRSYQAAHHPAYSIKQQPLQPMHLKDEANHSNPPNQPTPCASIEATRSPSWSPSRLSHQPHQRSFQRKALTQQQQQISSNHTQSIQQQVQLRSPSSLELEAAPSPSLKSAGPHVQSAQPQHNNIKIS